MNYSQIEYSCACSKCGHTLKQTDEPINPYNYGWERIDGKPICIECLEQEERNEAEYMEER